jgi:hypothetical protein
MSTSSPLLPLTLIALDHLERDALQREAEALVAHVHPEATALQVTQAVQASLAAMPVALPAVTPPAEPFDFGWARPTCRADHERLAAPRWLERKSDLSAFTIIGSLPLILSSGVGFLVASQDILVVPFFFFATLLPFGSGMFYLVDRFFSSQRYQPYTGELCQPSAEYLRYPATRDYLRAVLSSPIPTLLQADVRVLERRYRKASAPDRKAQARAAKVARKAQRQQAVERAQAQALAEQKQAEQASRERLAAFARALQ